MHAQNQNLHCWINDLAAVVPVLPQKGRIIAHYRKINKCQDTSACAVKRYYQVDPLNRGARLECIGNPGSLERFAHNRVYDMPHL
jgi:hypothetical protein